MLQKSSPLIHSYHFKRTFNAPNKKTLFTEHREKKFTHFSAGRRFSPHKAAGKHLRCEQGQFHNSFEDETSVVCVKGAGSFSSRAGDNASREQRVVYNRARTRSVCMRRLLYDYLSSALARSLWGGLPCRDGRVVAGFIVQVERRGWYCELIWIYIRGCIDDAV